MPARSSLARATSADLVVHVGLAQRTVSGHLACLRDCGLVVSRPDGRATIYSMARPELIDLLRAAEDLLAATGRGPRERHRHLAVHWQSPLVRSLGAAGA